MKLQRYIISLAVLLSFSIHAQSLNIGQDGRIKMQTPDGAVSSDTSGGGSRDSSKQGLSSAENDSSLISVSVKDRKLQVQNKFNNNKLVPVDYINASLVGKDFSGKKLAGLSFTRADLTNANFESADLSGAKLTNAKLINTNLKKANLFKAEITNANFTGAKLEGATWINGRICGKNSVGICR